MPTIKFKNATKQYDIHGHGVFDLNLDIDQGELVFITGASGAGKTTLVKLLLREIALTDGELYVNGEELTNMRRSQIPLYRRTIGVVFQGYNLIPNKTIWENVEMPFRIVGATEEETKRGVINALEMVNMVDRANDFPLELSGGEQQRIAIARAVAVDPKVILADEPTGNLDHENAVAVMKIFSELNNNGKTVVIASHDTFLISQTGKRVVRLAHGRIVK